MKTKRRAFWRQTFFAAVLLAVLTGISYARTFQGFFQQDEWLAFGFHFLIQNEGLVSLLKNAFILRLGHYSPLNLLFEQALFGAIGLNYFGWALNSIAMHFLNAVLVFVFAGQVFKDFKKAIAASVVFTVTASSFQATAWPVADIGTHMSVFFALASLILFFDFINGERASRLILSMALLVVSLLFKETAIALFAILPLAYVFFSNAKKAGKIRISAYVLIVGLLFISLRLFALLVPPEAYKGTIYEQAPSVSAQFDAGRFLYNVATFPVKGVSQTIVPSGMLLNIAGKISGLLPKSVAGQSGTTGYGLFTQKYALEAINFAVFLVFLVVCLRSGKVGVFFLVFIMANSVVYALSPERVGRITILDSRNLYFASIGAALLLVQISQTLFKFSLLGIFGFIGLLAVLNFYYLNYSLGSFVADGRLRSGILERIGAEYPNLPDKVVFYTESDSSFYGLPEETKIMPFQSGFGQTLIVWYYPREKFPDEFLKKKFLWEITDQGYMESGGRGFGYFRDLAELKKSISLNKLDPEAVIAYKYNSKMHGLTDITLEFRKELVK